MHNWWRIQPVGSVHRSQDTEEAKADKTRKGNKASTGSDYCKSEIFSWGVRPMRVSPKYIIQLCQKGTKLHKRSHKYKEKAEEVLHV